MLSAREFEARKDSLIAPRDTTIVIQNDSTVLADSSTVIIDTTLAGIADSLGAADSSMIKSDSTAAVPRDTLRPIYYKGFGEVKKGGGRLTRNTLERLDYRFAGDYINYMPFGFLRNLGYVGRPSESFVYGLGNGSVSYMKDGVPINNRYQEALDLNYLQTEEIDSLETISLARSFFYNNSSQPVSVNVITRDVIDLKPYTRLRFYQGQNSEGFIDGMFSGYVMKRMNTSVRFTNQTVDSRETNSTLSNWHINAKIRYMPGNFINVITTYDYSKMNIDLNGGVDYDKIVEEYTPDEYTEILYSDIDAPVIFEDRYRKSTGHNFSVKTLMKFTDNIFTDISAYYQYYQDKFRQDENYTDTTLATIKNNSTYNTLGIKLHHLVDYPFANLEVLAGYERNDFDLDFNSSADIIDKVYAGGKLEGVFLDEHITPSVFAKYTNDDEGGAMAYGFDAGLKINNSLSLYAGYSDVDRNSYQYLTGDWITDGFNTIQAGVNFKCNWFAGSLSYINVDYNNYAFAVTSDVDSLKQSQAVGYMYDDISYSGLNMAGSFYLYKFQLRTNTTYYFDQSSSINKNIPSFSSFGGLYYVDSLFQGNLDLVAGVNYKFYGERNYLNYDYQLLQPIYYQTTSTGYQRINTAVIDPNFQLDLFVSGRIRKHATVFIAFENILDEQYYIVPYYPMPGSGYRLGITWEFID